MKFITIITIIFLIAACGKTSAKKASATSGNAKKQVTSSTLDFCPQNYVSSYKLTESKVIQLEANNCLISEPNCSVNDYIDAQERIELFKSLYPYQADCKITDSENTWEIHVTDFDDEYNLIMSLLY
ncbi:MAG: hypothetical protein A2381_04460 [Bdellovibrionales bacterium RIFOXYB1_FULL_37_110]|nr:MAG: hypothetical protein A2417_16040 [Bdellovibrionales bacterium RIFOXYC1_FULL_37_79]OFZ57420.1 MAG: hypothetical protein A2381_04460 [Bdellovibrionales bacterium RIFOXYB1_FULL_37_110]OFZ62272.1 MAG: hypothetical protein A2577_12980 [Bdellovibrionales bacterium RIFOXYD1_FULL_36_51]